MRRAIQTAFALAVAVLPVSIAFGYTKPNTYRAATLTCTTPGNCIFTPGKIVFAEQVAFSPHSWAIPKAIQLLRTDGFQAEADLAQKYLLPMLEGVTFNDVWGDADMAGGSVLDYYDPDSPQTGYGYGCVLDGFIFAPYKNCTSTFATHPLYGYRNAAEHAQFRYDYGKRIYLGNWGADPRDTMAGWVIDTIFGQDDPMDGRWASGAVGIDAATSPGGTQSHFGTGLTPALALQDLFEKHTNSEVVFPQQSDDALSSIHVPTDEVFEHAPEWLDDQFNNADDVEAYMGWDGHDSAVYANWTLDAAGHCNGGAGCAAPMVVRLPVGSKAHAFFQLGWAIHLLEDNTTPVHTVNGSYEAYERHNDIESLADYVLNGASVNAGLVSDLLPALNTADFTQIYDWPPTPADASCPPNFPTNPSVYFHTRWYTDSLNLSPVGATKEGVAHAYTRNSAEMAHAFIPYIACIDTERDHNWPSMGFFTALALDNAIKATAGLIRQFIEDVDKTPPAARIVAPSNTTYLHSATLILSYTSATDDESGVKSVTPTLDGNTSLAGHGLSNGQQVRLLTEMTLGNHTFTVAAVDNAGNTASPSETFSIIATPASIIDDVNYFLSSGDIAGSNEGRSLLQKLREAAADRTAGDCSDANESYVAFIKQLKVQSGRKVGAAAAAIMIADAQYLLTRCPRRT